MMSLFNISLGTYFLSLIMAVVALVTRRRLFTIAAVGFLSVGVVALAGYMGLRWMHAGRAPFSNMFESLVLLGWTITFVYLLLRFKVSIPALDAAVALLALLTLAYASMQESDIQPLMPALRSNWLTVHVLTCMLAYGGFAVSFIAAIGYLISARTGTKVSIEVQNGFDATVMKTVSFGFLFLSIGIITGAVWANVAWGTYWSWDPKETWSLITWIIYAIFLHCRYLRGWSGKRSAWISLVGFICVLMTYLGVNFLMKGLHSYA